MCAEHLGIILYNSIGLSLPDSAVPRLVVGITIISVLVNCNLSEFAVYDVSGGLPGLHRVGHHAGSQNFLRHCTEGFHKELRYQFPGYLGSYLMAPFH